MYVGHIWEDYIVNVNVSVRMCACVQACIDAFEKALVCPHVSVLFMSVHLCVCACVHICLDNASYVRAMFLQHVSYVHILIFSSERRMATWANLKPVSQHTIKSTCLHCRIRNAWCDPLSNTERTGLCNLHDAASAFGIIYIIFAYKVRIHWARQGLLGWIMGLSRSCSPSLRGPLLWWGLKVKGRGSEATHPNVKWFLSGVVMGVAALRIYESMFINLLRVGANRYSTCVANLTYKRSTWDEENIYNDHASCFLVSYFWVMGRARRKGRAKEKEKRNDRCLLSIMMSFMRFCRRSIFFFSLS